MKRASSNHSAKEYVRGDAHVNMVEGLGEMVHRAVYGIHHQVSRQHLDRYLDELSYRWSRRQILEETNAAGHEIRRIVTTPFDRQLAELLPGVVGRGLHWTRRGGLRWMIEAALSS